MTECQSGSSQEVGEVAGAMYNIVTYILTNENYQCAVINDVIAMVIQEWNNS